MSHELVADLGGLPMIDDLFKPSAIATLVCAVRQRLDKNRQPLIAYLQPELALACYRNVSPQPIIEYETIDLTVDEKHRIRLACEEIIATVPAWRIYFSIPLRWQRLTNHLFSSSNPMIPQRICLGEHGIQSKRLAEYIVHEISHIWVGMIAELAPLAEPGEAVHVLPSGTGGKEIRQVIYALTFATTAVRFYRRRIVVGCAQPEDRERLAYLEHYAEACLTLVESSDLLLPNGKLIAESCRCFLSS